MQRNGDGNQMTLPIRPSPSRLLALPSELREQIWASAFSNTHVTSFERWYLGPSPSTREVSCDPCNREWSGIFPTGLSYRAAFGPLLSCKQIYNEALDKFLSTLILHLDTPHAITGTPTRYESRVAVNLIGTSTSKHHNLNQTLRHSARRLCLYIHLDDFTRGSWCTALGHVRRSFPNLERLDVHNHMRPPTSYDNLVDAIYLIGPLCVMGEPFGLNEYYTKPSSNNEDEYDSASSNASDDSETEDHDNLQHTNPPASSTSNSNDETNTQADHAVSPKSPQSRPDSQPPAPRNLYLHLSYPQPNVPMFHAPHLGAITTSDSLHEHSLVLRELFHDADFVSAAQQKRLNEMTGALLAVARDHERPWYERLQRRRLVAMRMEMMGWDEDRDQTRKRIRRREVNRLVRRELRAMEEAALVAAAAEVNDTAQDQSDSDADDEMGEIS